MKESTYIERDYSADENIVKPKYYFMTYDHKSQHRYFWRVKILEIIMKLEEIKKRDNYKTNKKNDRNRYRVYNILMSF